MCALAGAAIGTPLVATSAAAAAIIENLSISKSLSNMFRLINDYAPTSFLKGAANGKAFAVRDETVPF